MKLTMLGTGNALVTKCYNTCYIFENENDVQIVMKNMAAEEITFNVDTIAERFVRGDESRNTEGSGLGLAIAKSFVELQGGSFKIEVDGDLFKVIMNFKKN